MKLTRNWTEAMNRCVAVKSARDDSREPAFPAAGFRQTGLRPARGAGRDGAQRPGARHDRELGVLGWRLLHQGLGPVPCAVRVQMGVVTGLYENKPIVAAVLPLLGPDAVDP